MALPCLYFPGDNPVFCAQALVLRTELAQIGITIVSHPLPFNIYYSVLGKRDEPFDIAFAGEFPLYPGSQPRFSMSVSMATTSPSRPTTTSRT